MSEQKFNKGDLVELPSGARLFVSGMADHDECGKTVTTYSLCYEVDGYKDLFSKNPEDLKLIKPAKQYITVNGHKVPKPLKIPTNLYYTPSLQTDDLYDSHGFDLNFPDDEFALRMVHHGLVFSTKEDAIAMSKALLSAIPKGE